MKLNIGCGEFHADGWINLDLHADGPKPDVLGSILNMPFPDSTATQVYCGHVLEHLAVVDLEVALREVRRVAAGEVMIVGPDLNLARLFDPALEQPVRDGGRRWVGDMHCWVPTGEQTLEHVLAAGFDAKLIPVAIVSDEWPIVSRDWWQFAIQAKEAT